ncbi:MAG: response regulator [Deltaproteobacteria bacterium]|nr:response regulator [Deltaproteobacteria bacterium]
MTRTKKIMVVDDEAGIRNLLFDVLSEEGFMVTLAKDGEDSLRQMQKTRYDLVITDINMPRLGGMELIRRMKMDGRKEKIIIMSGKPIDLSKNKKEIPKVFALLNKPFHMNLFLEVVSSAFLTVNMKKCDGREISRKGKLANAV